MFAYRADGAASSLSPSPPHVTVTSPCVTGTWCITCSRSLPVPSATSWRIGMTRMKRRAPRRRWVDLGDAGGGVRTGTRNAAGECRFSAEYFACAFVYVFFRREGDRQKGLSLLRWDGSSRDAQVVFFSRFCCSLEVYVFMFHWITGFHWISRARFSCGLQNRIKAAGPAYITKCSDSPRAIDCCVS